MNRTDFFPVLDLALSGRALSAAQSEEAFGRILSGNVPEDDLADFLLALAERPPEPDELVGAARAMRASMAAIEAPAGAIDLCGTGGDGLGTLSISTAVQFVVAGCGVPVAKHGNRSATSRAGAADVLERLGVRIGLEPRASEACLREAATCFLFAQRHHPAMKHVAEVRRQIGVRTIFNLLGPLSNPANVRRQLLGVYSLDLLEIFAHALRALGTERAWIVHGEDGLDELTVTGVSHVAVLEGGQVSRRLVRPEDAGLSRADASGLKGGDAAYNAAAISRLLEGESGPYRDVVLLNAAAALVVAGRAADLREGAAMAAGSIGEGRARRALDRLVQLSNGTPP
jgi:anthranilate phosphoribosyltransferase